MSKLQRPISLCLFYYSDMASVKEDIIRYDDEHLFSFNEYPVYSGDLWIEYTPEYTVFKLWSPKANDILLCLYENGHSSDQLGCHELEKHGDSGLWQLELKGDLKGRYYTYQVIFKGSALKETPGIYANAVGVNGQRAMVIDMQSTNPEGWIYHPRPELKSLNDIILYELHVRDYTINPNAGSSYPGKYLGLVESGTKSPNGLKSGIDHLKELGITHVHLLPVFDHRSIDENNLETPQFNWGYDPQNFNVPEGSYSSDPYNAEVRIREFKEMILGFHSNGIRVIMDVVFNHTGATKNSNFNLEAPGYYYRQNEDGSLSDASGCGNETASERPMMRKFIIESCKFWANEYKIDGFRFDLMGIHDIDTLNVLSQELHKIDPTIFVYGEGWTGGASPLPDSLRAIKTNTRRLTDIAAFSDDMRDGIKGSVFDVRSTGFVNGGEGFNETVKFGVVAATLHPQIDYYKLKYSDHPWSNKPSQTINYVSCHDNNTLYDKLVISRPDAGVGDIKRMHMLANAIVLTSQGIPFLHAGVELMRTKQGEHNSYNKPDEVNMIDWQLKSDNHDVMEYYKRLIALRKNHPAFRLTSTKMIAENIHFFKNLPDGIVAFQLSDNANGDVWKNILCIYNACTYEYDFLLPDGEWDIAVQGSWIVEEGLGEAKIKVKVPPVSFMLLNQH